MPKLLQKTYAMMILQNKNKAKGEVIKMFKKVTIATAFSAALLLGGAIQSVDASASFDPSQSQENVSHQNDSSDYGNRYIYYGTFHDFLANFFHNNRGNWHTNNKEDSNHHENTEQETGKQDEKAPEETEESNNNSNDETGQTEENENNTNNESGQ